MGLRSTLTGPTAFAGRGEAVVDKMVRAAFAAAGMVRKARRDACCWLSGVIDDDCSGVVMVRNLGEWVV